MGWKIFIIILIIINLKRNLKRKSEKKSEKKKGKTGHRNILPEYGKNIIHIFLQPLDKILKKHL